MASCEHQNERDGQEKENQAEAEETGTMLIYQSVMWSVVTCFKRFILILEIQPLQLKSPF